PSICTWPPAQSAPPQREALVLCVGSAHTGQRRPSPFLLQQLSPLMQYLQHREFPSSRHHLTGSPPMSGHDEYHRRRCCIPMGRRGGQTPPCSAHLNVRHGSIRCTCAVPMRLSKALLPKNLRCAVSNHSAGLTKT